MELKNIRLTIGITQTEASLFLRVPLRTYKRYESTAAYSNSIKYKWMCESLFKYSISKDTNSKSYNIVIAGCGYVGLSLACLLSKYNNVVITDIVKSKIDLINKGISPISDNLITEYLKNKKINAVVSDEKAYSTADIIIIATSTDFNVKTNCFDTSSIEQILQMAIKVNKKAIIVIKSTIPLGYTNYLIQKYKNTKICFSPEFLREGQALYDNLYPSRIIVGYSEKTKKCSILFASLLKKASLDNKVVVLLMTNDEAEATKLFSNAYLAMRVSFFNELDTYAETKKLDSSKIINGVSLDKRIGCFYNNPSFGYGGYCLPKDTAQLANSFLDIPNNNLISAIVQSNATRKNYIVQKIIEKAIKVSGKKREDLVIGVYLLSMKTNSDNHRSSSTLDIVGLLKQNNIKTIIYDPHFCESEKSLKQFLLECDFYIANRYDKNIQKIKNRLYSRDIFSRD